jgi:hypothetical protein
MQREGVSFPISGFETKITLPVEATPSPASSGSDNTVVIIAVAASVGGVAVIGLMGVLLYRYKKVNFVFQCSHSMS